jgi:hypothetical protein
MNEPYNFIAAPPIIAERDRVSAERSYWLKTHEGHYERKSNHQLRAHARRNRQKGHDLIHQAEFGEGCGTDTVRCIAGLMPGIYQERDKTFLNPYFVPLSKLVAAEKPPDEFINLATRLRQLIEKDRSQHEPHKRWQISEEVTETKKRLIEIYKEVRQVKAVGGLYAHPWRLLNMSRHLGEFPKDDHCRLFRGKRGFTWTSQPYDLCIAEVIGFARLHQLAVTVSSEWSWHYPGHSLLIEWSAR